MELKAVNVVFIYIVVLSFLQNQVSGCGGGGGGGGGGDGGGDGGGCTAVHCKVSSWSEWEGCSHECGTTGVDKRTRYKTQNENGCGSCTHQLEESKPCNRYVCKHGGTPIPGRCSCVQGRTGTCCGSGK